MVLGFGRCRKDTSGACFFFPLVLSVATPIFGGSLARRVGKTCSEDWGIVKNLKLHGKGTGSR